MMLAVTSFMPDLLCGTVAEKGPPGGAHNQHTPYKTKQGSAFQQYKSINSLFCCTIIIITDLINKWLNKPCIVLIYT